MKTKIDIKFIVNKVLMCFSEALFYFAVMLSPFIAYGYIHKTPVTLFGANVSVVTTGSMKNSGFNIGDTLILRRINPHNIKVGDAIAFYYEASEIPNRNELQTYVSVKTVPNNLSFNEMFGINNKYFLEASKKNRFVCFHQVVNIYIDKNGELWFETWGTSNVDNEGNKYYDKKLTNENYVVGKYSRRPYLIWIITSLALKFGLKNVLICVCTVVFISIIIRYSLVFRKLYLSNKLYKRELSITNKVFTPKFFLETSLKDRAKLLSSAKPNELIIYKEKLFNSKYINYYKS